jgi:hypothetical protein
MVSDKAYLVPTSLMQCLFQLSDVVAGQYVFKLRVEDEQGLSSEDTATVIIDPGNFSCKSIDRKIK